MILEDLNELINAGLSLSATDFEKMALKKA